jgi:hypothetical protein
MALTHIPITHHGDLADLGLDQHDALMPVSGIRPFTGNVNVGGNQIGNCSQMAAGLYKGASDLKLGEDCILMGLFEEAEICYDEVGYEEEPAWLFRLRELAGEVPMVMEAFGVVIHGTDEVFIDTPDMLWVSSSYDGTVMQSDDEGVRFGDLGGEPFEWFFDVYHANGGPVLSVDHHGASVEIFDLDNNQLFYIDSTWGVFGVGLDITGNTAIEGNLVICEGDLTIDIGRKINFGSGGEVSAFYSASNMIIKNNDPEVEIGLLFQQFDEYNFDNNVNVLGTTTTGIAGSVGLADKGRAEFWGQAAGPPFAARGADLRFSNGFNGVGVMGAFNFVNNAYDWCWSDAVQASGNDLGNAAVNFITGNCRFGDIDCDDITAWDILANDLDVNNIQCGNITAEGDLRVDGISYLGDGGTTDYAKVLGNGQFSLHGAGRVKNLLTIKANGAGPGLNTPTLNQRDVGASGNVKIEVLSFSNLVVNDSLISFDGPYSIDDTVNVKFVIKWKPGPGYTGGNFATQFEYLVKSSTGDITTGTPTTITADVTPANADDMIVTAFAATIDLNAGDVLAGTFSRQVGSDNGDAVMDIREFALEVVEDKLGMGIAA